MTAPLCFIDTETTGLHLGRQVWEIAMIRRDEASKLVDGQPGEPQQEEVSFFVDCELDQADLFGLNVGRFYERHPYGLYLSGRTPDPFVNDVKQELLRPRDAAHAVARFTHGAHLVGSVPNFDTETCAPLLRENGLVPAWHYHLIDVENLAVGYLSHLEQTNMAEARKIDPDIQFKPSLAAPPWDSEAISRALHVEPPGADERHTALGDARWAMRLYDAVMGGEVA